MIIIIMLIMAHRAWLQVEVHKTAFNALTGDQEGEPVKTHEWFGSIPIMVQSHYCRLNGMTDKDKCDYGECTFDQGGYFIINGSEKVLIAQERQAYNRVYCFNKRPPSKLSWVAGEQRVGAPLHHAHTTATVTTTHHNHHDDRDDVRLQRSVPRWATTTSLAAPCPPTCTGAGTSTPSRRGHTAAARSASTCPTYCKTCPLWSRSGRWASRTTAR